MDLHDWRCHLIETEIEGLPPHNVVEGKVLFAKMVLKGGSDVQKQLYIHAQKCNFRYRHICPSQKLTQHEL